MIAIRPPVLVPQMRSKYSHGKGNFPSAVTWPLCFMILCTSCISRWTMRSEERPRTPPPSRARIRGICVKVLVVAAMRKRIHGLLLSVPCSVIACKFTFNRTYSGCSARLATGRSEGVRKCCEEHLVLNYTWPTETLFSCSATDCCYDWYVAIWGWS